MIRNQLLTGWQKTKKHVKQRLSHGDAMCSKGGLLFSVKKRTRVESKVPIIFFPCQKLFNACIVKSVVVTMLGYKPI